MSWTVSGDGTPNITACRMPTHIFGFYKESIAGLASSYARGKRVSTRPDLRYVVIRRRASGHGHVAVYNFNDTEVHILHVFHTAQDWQTKLVEEKA
jgi:plasmid stabilization system protein ParE